MKKFISCALILALCLAAFAGCGAEAPAPTTAEAVVETTAPAAADNLGAAKEYLFTMYKDALEATPADYTVVGALVVGTDAFEVEWSADSDTVKFVRGDDKMVTVDVDEQNPQEVTYNLTATIKDAAGNTESVSFAHRVPAYINLVGMTDAEIAAAAYDLDDGASMPAGTTLTGVITKIDTPWNPEYKNVTVTIAVEGAEDKPVQCFRLSGEGADKLVEGDTIAVAGVLKNFKGTVEFDKGCKLIPTEAAADIKVALAGYGLEEGLAMKEPVSMTGIIKSIDTAYSEKYDNITVTIVAGGMEEYAVQCFRMVGKNLAELKVGDSVSVTGILKNYKGTVEFDAGCMMNAVK